MAGSREVKRFLKKEAMPRGWEHTNTESRGNHFLLAHREAWSDITLGSTPTSLKGATRDMDRFVDWSMLPGDVTPRSSHPEWRGKDPNWIAERTGRNQSANQGAQDGRR